MHEYGRRGKFLVTLNVSNNFSYDTQFNYLDIDWWLTPYNASILSSTIPSEMVRGTWYTVGMEIKNTGSSTWFGDPTNPDYVYLTGVGGATGDAAKFNLMTRGGNEPVTEIPLLNDENTRYYPVQDFIFNIQAPVTPGTYEPSFRLSSKRGEFGDFMNFSVNVTTNPSPNASPNRAQCSSCPEPGTDLIGEIYSGIQGILRNFSRFFRQA